MSAREPGTDRPQGPDRAGLPDLVERMLVTIELIPPGRVATYGDVGEAMGGPGPRRIGALMSRYGALTTWWRVIRSDGTLPDALHREAMTHWRAEGTPLRAGGVDMRLARWDGRSGRRAAGPAVM